LCRDPSDSSEIRAQNGLFDHLAGAGEQRRWMVTPLRANSLILEREIVELEESGANCTSPT